LRKIDFPRGIYSQKPFFPSVILHEFDKKFGKKNAVRLFKFNFFNPSGKDMKMPRGDKSSYNSKQKRMAQHIEEGYEKRGGSAKKAKRIAWATVNKETGGAGKKVKNTSPSKKGGRKGGKAKKSARTVH
jgi:hypothetical protein